MNFNPLIRDVGRVIISIAVLGVWLYCEVTNLTCAGVLRPVSMGILTAWLGVEGLLKFIEGINTGKYTKE